MRETFGLLVQRQHGAVADDAGAGNSDVDLTEGFDSRLDELGGIGLARHVGLHANDFAAGFLNFLDDAVDILLRHVDDDDLGAVLRKVFGNGLADTVTTASDDGNTALDFHFDSFSVNYLSGRNEALSLFQ